MRVLLLPYCFHPDPHGGTEVYVEALAHELRRLDIAAHIAAPGPSDEHYEVRGLPVHRYALSPEPIPLEQQYGEGDPHAAGRFSHLLNAVQPDLVHLHAFTSGVSLRVARVARAAGLPVVVTYHTPTVTCPRGTLLRWGSQICDGRMDAHRCTACVLQYHGLPKTPALALSAVGSILPAIPRQGGIWTALRMRRLIERRLRATKDHLAEATHIVAVCEWVRQLLIDNGVPSSRLTLSRQGLPFQGEVPQTASVDRSGPIRIAYFGRLDAAKGIHVLIQALQLIPAAALHLDIYGVSQGSGQDAFLDTLYTAAGQDPRIRFLPPVSADEVTPTMRRYDRIAIPSQCLETGPLVAYEALAAGVPVIGSNLGGIAEILRDQPGCELVPHNNPAAWSSTLEQLASTSPRKQLMQPSSDRTMRHAAQEMRQLYQSLQPACPSRDSATGTGWGIEGK